MDEQFQKKIDELMERYVFSITKYELTIVDENIRDWILQRIRNNNLHLTRIIGREERYTILKRQKWRCNNCGKALKFNKHSEWEGEIAHIDHIHPFAERFSYPAGVEMINQICNLQGLCEKCNLTKGKKKN